jgi:hypothetical protein
MIAAATRRAWTSASRRAIIGTSVTEAEKLADRIRQTLPRVRSGTLRFSGQWFGRPHDNVHTVVSSEAAGECFRVAFNEGETLPVWSPRGATIDEATFRIDDAARVRWECTITASTNAAWDRPVIRPDQAHPAVEIVSGP